jgi:hypothetical protein
MLFEPRRRFLVEKVPYWVLVDLNACSCTSWISPPVSLNSRVGCSRTKLEPSLFVTGVHVLGSFASMFLYLLDYHVG